MNDNSLDSPDVGMDSLDGSPDLNPVELPGANIAPSVEDRLTAIEDILNINY